MLKGHIRIEELSNYKWEFKKKFNKRGRTRRGFR
jgi:hypothetical protein